MMFSDKLSDRLGELCDVVGGADQRPLCLHGLKAAQQELSKSSCLLDVPEHRLHDLLSQSVPAAITGALQLLPHFLRHLVADLARSLALENSEASNSGGCPKASPRASRFEIDDMRRNSTVQTTLFALRPY